MKKAGTEFRIGEDLYSVSIATLEHRLDVLAAESERIKREITKKAKQKQAAEAFFTEN